MADAHPNDRVGWIDRIVFAVLVIVVLGWMVAGSGCADPDFTVAAPLVLAPADGIAEDGAIDTDPMDTIGGNDTAATSMDAARDTAPDAAAETIPPDAAAEAKPDTAPPDTDGMVSTPGHVDCTNKSAAACTAFACDESADCAGGARCCLRPDGTGSTCDCSGASMDGWIVLCLTEGDCYGGKHCTPWAAWDHHGRCL